MKEIAQLILKLRMLLSVMCLDKESGKNFASSISSESQLSILDRYETRGLAIATDYHDIRAIRFTKPNYSLIEDFYTKLGLKSDYCWSVKSPDHLTLILRIRHQHSILPNPKLKKPIAEDVLAASQSGMFRLVPIVDQYGKILLSKEPTLDEPPFVPDRTADGVLGPRAGRRRRRRR